MTKYQDKKPIKILIAGLPKSGTTALFYRIRNSLVPPFEELFEHTSYDALKLHDKNVVAKILIIPKVDFSHFESFDKKVLIVRDPRDRLISQLLYGSAFNKFPERPDPEILEFKNILSKKEKDPDSIPLSKIIMNVWEKDFTARIRKPLDLLREFHIKNPDYYVFKYEDLIEGEFSALKDYLGFDISPDQSIAPRFQRVARTKTSGSWKDWFCPEDISLLSPILEDFMKHFDYDFSSWKTKIDKRISPDHCSEYFLKVLNEKRELLGKTKIDPDRV